MIYNFPLTQFCKLSLGRRQEEAGRRAEAGDNWQVEGGRRQWKEAGGRRRRLEVTLSKISLYEFGPYVSNAPLTSYQPTAFSQQHYLSVN